MARQTRALGLAGSAQALEPSLTAAFTETQTRRGCRDDGAVFEPQLCSNPNLSVSVRERPSAGPSAMTDTAYTRRRAVTSYLTYSLFLKHALQLWRT